MDRTLDLPEDPAAAVAVLQAASAEEPVLVFKRSPICPTSFTAERQLRLFLEQLDDGAALRTASIDVIAERALARGLTAELGVQQVVGAVDDRDADAGAVVAGGLLVCRRISKMSSTCFWANSSHCKVTSSLLTAFMPLALNTFTRSSLLAVFLARSVMLVML